MELPEEIYRLVLKINNNFTDLELKNISLNDFEDDLLYLELQYLIFNHEVKSNPYVDKDIQCREDECSK